MNTIDKVHEFHTAFGHPIAAVPMARTQKIRELRVKLIAEELGELAVALGVRLTISVEPDENGFFNNYNTVLAVEAVAPDEEVDLTEAADALGDIDYVVQGANLVFGFPAEKIITEIHRANMSKLGADGKPVYREDGKILKGPSYTPPDIRPILIQAREDYVNSQTN